jgi:hypothetical protein
MLSSKEVGSEVVDLSLFPDFVDRMRRILVQDSTGTSPSQRATKTYALLLVAGLFIDSQSLVGDGASSDLAMVEARRLFQRPLALASAGNSRDGSEFFLSFRVLSAKFLEQLFSWYVF